MYAFMGDFIILALALNFFWLPSLVNFILDSLSIIGGDEAHCSKIMLQYGNSGDTLRVKIFGWFFVPLGWFAAAFLLTERAGCNPLVHLASC